MSCCDDKHLPEHWEPTGTQDDEGRPIWLCRNRVCKLVGAQPRGKCRCKPLSLCRHLHEQLGTVPCGCGASDKLLPVFRCDVHGVCTERSTGKPQRFEGAKIAVCLGCPQKQVAASALPAS